MKVFYQRRGLLEKASTVKRFEYSSLGSELEMQTNTAKTQYQELDKVYEFDKKESDKIIKMTKNQHLKNIINQI